ncbi:MAG: hypothetical protein KDB61_05135, partial [Planctomycetes bacterium]|nr:hypothetical protein [Planctomycetota bacterium]
MRLILPLALFLLPACTSEPQPAPEPTVQTASDLGADRVLFPANQAKQVRFLGYDQAADFWTPTNQQVLELDRRLPELLREAMADPASVDPWVEKNPDSANW